MFYVLSGGSFGFFAFGVVFWFKFDVSLEASMIFAIGKFSL